MTEKPPLPDPATGIPENLRQDGVRVLGVDYSSTGDTHVEGYWLNGVLHITRILHSTNGGKPQH